MTKETYKEDLLPEVIERSLKDIKPNNASDVLRDIYYRYPQIVAPYLSRQDYLSLREYETRKQIEEADDAE